MTTEDFELEAANFFLCEAHEELTVAQQYKLLQEAEDEIPEGVIIWEPFENYPLEDLMEQIDRFADIIRKIYYAGRSAQQGDN